MIGVLIVAGIIGYGVLYSGVADVKGKPVGIGKALFPSLGKATASSFPAPKNTSPGPATPKQGRP